MKGRRYYTKYQKDHIYEYHWTVFKKGIQEDSRITLSDRFYVYIPKSDDEWVVIVNATTNYIYPPA